MEAERPQRRFAELRPPGPPAVRVRFRAEWVETLPADWQPPGPGDTVILDPEVELTVWSVERIAIGLEVGLSDLTNDSHRWELERALRKPETAEPEA